jgi:hypothetical protein
MFGILLGDDGQVANLISVVVLKILQRFLKVQSDLVGNLVGRHDSSKGNILFAAVGEREERKRKKTTSHG